jgi:hypothetical protein
VSGDERAAMLTGDLAPRRGHVVNSLGAAQADYDDLPAEVGRLRVANDRLIAEMRALYRFMPYSLYLQTPHWQAMRQATWERCGNRCQLCNSQDGLHVHHRTYENLGRENPEDLIVLCSKCHAKFHDKLPLPDGTSVLTGEPMPERLPTPIRDVAGAVPSPVVGMRVSSPKFGMGEVVHVKVLSDGAADVSIQFPDGVHTLAWGLARLEVVPDGPPSGPVG